MDHNVVEKNITIDIDYEKLADAIVTAHKKMQLEKERKKEREHEEWRKVLGINECKDCSNRSGCIYRIRKLLLGIWKLLFLKRKEAKTTFATYVLIGEMMSWILLAFEVILYVFSGFLVLVSVYNIQEKIIRFNFISLTWAILIWMVARIIRVVSMEISNVKEKEELVTIISAFTALSSLIISIIALFISIK